MSKLVLQFSGKPREGPCALCGTPTVQDLGPQLSTRGKLAIVCAACGHKHVPGLCAVLELTQAAARVGKISLHARFRVPLAVLMELSRAAGIYHGFLHPDRKAG